MLKFLSTTFSLGRVTPILLILSCYTALHTTICRIFPASGGLDQVDLGDSSHLKIRIVLYNSNVAFKINVPIIITVAVSFKPSISASNCETTLSITPPESPATPLLGARESNSSKNIMQGAASLAR